MLSMTGFGRAVFELAGSAYRIELRSVNHRYLEQRIIVPWPDASLEHQIRRAIRQNLGRGRVDTTVSARPDADGGLRGLARDNAQKLGQTLRELAAEMGVDLQVAATIMASRPELLVSSEQRVDSSQRWGGVRPALDAAIAALIEMRRREGATLAAQLDADLKSMRGLKSELSRTSSFEPERCRQRLQDRLAALLKSSDGAAVGLDPDRVAQEVAIVADRCDVSEELVRVQSHIDQLAALFESCGPIGRQIEFLLQELNRELNTIGAKTGDSQVTQLVVQAKGVLERMREQAQNVE